MRIHERMTNEEVLTLVSEYFKAEGYQFPGDFEHRVDPDSSAVMYSMIREYKPKNVVHAGTWRGGSACIIMSALQKNGGKFKYVASEIADDLRGETEQNVLKKCGAAPQMVGDVTKNLRYYPKEIDCLFHDTNHDRETTEWVVENIFPRLKPGALVMFHDWAVFEKDGKWLGKGAKGEGAWPETEYLLELQRAGKLPLKKVYWNFDNPLYDGGSSGWELGVFLKV